MNITGKFLKVWKVQKQNGYTKLDLGDSKKNKDGEYDNWNWYGCLMVGNAKDVEVNEGDVVEIKSGIISKRKYEGKFYDDIVIFALEVTKKAEPEVPDISNFEMVDDSETPF